MTTDDVVFGEPGDLTLLGARSLEGLNARIDPVTKRLVDAGPMPLAAIVERAARGEEIVTPKPGSRARLSSRARSAIETADQVYVSAVSGWEIAIKTSLGRLSPRHMHRQAS